MYAPLHSSLTCAHLSLYCFRNYRLVVNSSLGLSHVLTGPPFVLRPVTISFSWSAQVLSGLFRREKWKCLVTMPGFVVWDQYVLASTALVSL